MNKRLKVLASTLTVCITLFTFEALSQPFSLKQTPNLPALGNSSIALADFNKDGFIDVFLTGNNEGSIETGVFLNQGDTTFLNLGIGIKPVEESDAVIADFNNDNFPDLAYTGVTSSDNVIFRLLINNQDSTFQEKMVSEISGIKNGEIGAADFNNNGYQDVFITGRNGKGEFIAEIYKNNGNLEFDLITDTDFEGVYESALTVFDFNLDGKKDIFYSGINESLDRVVHYYKNNGNLNFEDVNNNLPALATGSMISMHTNSDIYPDLFISGKNSSGNYITKIYENHLGSNFILLDTLEGVYRSSASAIDYNNDGYTDIALQGTNNDDFRRILLYRNDGNDDFVRDTLLGKSSFGDISRADFNRDSRQDLILTGYSYSGARTDIWINEGNTSNESPDVPVDLVSSPSADSVVLSWKNATDDITPKKNLEYNIFLASVEKENYIVSPLADTSTGELLTTQKPYFQDSTISIQNLSESRYFWGVQSIDQSAQASTFSVIDTFNICHGFSLGEDIHTCQGDTISIEPEGLNGNIEWYNSDNPDTPFSTDSVISFETISEDTIWAKLTNSYGCIQRDTIQVHLYNHPNPQIGSDTSLCYNEKLTLEAGNPEDTVNWYNFEGEQLAEDTTHYANRWRESDSIFVEVTTPKGCVNRDTLFVNVFQKPQWSLGRDTSICRYDSLTIQAPDLYQPVSWHVDNKHFADSANSVKLSVDDSLNVVLNVVDSNECRTADTLSVKDNPLPDANAGKDTLICPGTKAVIGPYGSTNEWTFSWTPTEPLDDASLKNPLASPDSGTKFFLEVTNQYGCTDIDSMKVRINPPSAINAGSDTSICLGDSIKLGGNPTAEGSILPYNYKWEPINSVDDPGNSNPRVWPGNDTEYNLVTYTAHCPVDTAMVKITVNPLPKIKIKNDTMVGYNEPFDLWAKGGKSYKWYPENAVEFNNEARVRARIKHEQTYSVEVTNEYGCSDMRSVHVGIKDEIFLPELFTPNGDGRNDYFRVYGFGIKRLHLKVFTMNGKLVYETREVDQAMNEGWNGTYKGKPLESGKYIWTLEGEKYNGDPVRFDGKNKGTVILIR